MSTNQPEDTELTAKTPQEKIEDLVTRIVVGQDGIYYYELREAAKYTVDGLEATQLGAVERLLDLIEAEASRRELELLKAVEEKVNIHWESNTVGDGVLAFITAKRQALTEKEGK